MKVANIIEKVKALPQNPGVYIFRDGKGKIIYIGKATNLKSRVSSYFRNYKGSERPIERMISEVAKIDYQETDTVLEALILESNLIKKNQPKYNVKEKDDKSFSYFVITREEFPKVLILRKTDLDKISNFEFRISNQYRISNDLIPKKLENSKLKHSRLVQNSKFKISNSKIYGPYTSKKQMEIALKIIRKIFPFHSNKQKKEKGCLDFQLGRCPGPYAGAISKRDYAKNIRGIQMILEGKKKSLLTKLEKEMQSLAKKEEFEKAGEIRNKIFALKHIQDIALISEDLNSKNQKPKTKNLRIEAYDISNISGQHAVGSMVVFENSEPNKKEYRKFKIKTVEGANDVAMMREVLSRRFNNKWTQPDLILLDGGQGHLNMAEKLLKDLGFAISLVAVAKGATRKISNSKFLISKQFPMSEFSNEIKNILNNKNLVKHITDEAHRFAIGYHRKLRKEAFSAG